MNLVDEVAALRDQISELISDLPETLLQLV